MKLTMRTEFLAAGVITALCLTVGSIADAQTLAPPVQRPAQGLFDRGGTSDHSLDLSVAVLGGYDDNLASAENNRGFDTQTQMGGSYNALTTNMAFSKKFSHGEFRLSEGSTLRYYPTLNDIVSAQHTATAGGVLQFAHTAVTMSQTFGYVPFFGFVSVPRLFDAGVAELPPAISDQVTVKRVERFFSSSVGVTQKIGGRTSLSLSASLRNNDFVHESTAQSNEDVGGRLSRNLTRDLSLVLGYTYQQSTFRQPTAASPIARLHNVDMGVDYNHALGRTRRTTIGFTTGSAAVQGVSQATEYRLTGNARLNREIGRTWHFTAAYYRGAGFVDGLQQPFFSDSMAVNLGGTVNRRVQLSFDGGYSTGQMGFPASSSQSDNYNGSARTTVALSRRATISGEYFFYHYRFGQATALPAGVPTRLDRQGVRLVFNLWLPLIR
jgi:hypothetical protein